MNSSRRVAVLSACLFLVGCGSGEPQRSNLTGKATFGGKPIVYGTIEFVPDTAKGHSGPAGSAEIVQGEFDTAKSQSGIFPGDHMVRVTAYEERPVTSEDETKPAPPSKPLVVGYAVPAKLTPPTFDLDIPESEKGKDYSAQSPSAGGRPVVQP